MARASHARPEELTPEQLLLARLRSVEHEVAAAVKRRSAAARGSAAEDPRGQGLFISPADVAALLQPPAQAPGRSRLVGDCATATSGGPAADRSAGVARAFGLDALDLAILLVAAAPDVDARFEGLYGYLNDDVTCRRPTVRLCLELCGIPVSAPWARARFRSDAPLLLHHLVELEEARPFPGRTVRVHDRVVDHLLGSDLPDPVVQPLALPPLTAHAPYGPLLRDALRNGARLVYLRSPPGQVDHASAAGALEELGLPVLQVDLRPAGADQDGVELAAAIAREAALGRTGLVVGPVDDMAARDGRSVAALAGAPVPLVLLGHGGWQPGWSQAPPVIVDVAQSGAVGTAVWRTILGGEAPPELVAAGDSFRLTPHQLRRAIEAANVEAAARDAPLDAEAIRAGARAQNGNGLESLARRVTPRATLDDLVLAEPAAGLVLETVARARLRHRVVDDWRMGGVGAGGRGVTVLFAGPSGTGKTLAAEVIAGCLGLDLYVVDLSSVVDKYVGETEKNLERIFRGAVDLNGVLFFDEADALFGKRSAVSDGHDRYANIEVAYLLQRMEQFDGISVLATNLTANIDDAFARRIDIRVVFPQPDVPERRRLWSRHLPPTLPLADDVDVDFLAGAFRLSGGEIRNITLAAAYEAAGSGRAVGMAELVKATAREFRQLGRLCTEEEFGPYLGLVAAGGGA